MTLIVLQHVDDVGLGALAASLEERGVDHVVHDAATAVDVTAASGLLLLGGDPGDTSDTELDTVRSAIAADVPVFGICHGAEVIATAVGGAVVQRERPEVGFVVLHRTAPGREDDVSAGWPDGAVAFAMHSSEVAALPKEADTLLIGSDGPSLWRLGNTYGTSLHLEADADTITAWLVDADDTIRAADLDPESLRAEVARRGPFVASAGVSLVLRWIDSLESE